LGLGLRVGDTVILSRLCPFDEGLSTAQLMPHDSTHLKTCRLQPKKKKGHVHDSFFVISLFGRQMCGLLMKSVGKFPRERGLGTEDITTLPLYDAAWTS